MTPKEFINSLANGKLDIIQILLEILEKTHSKYCLIGGLAVNAYVEPVVSLDLDIVAAVEDLEVICGAAVERGLVRILPARLGHQLELLYSAAWPVAVSAVRRVCRNYLDVLPSVPGDV
jgi:hypothetical protein